MSGVRTGVEDQVALVADGEMTPRGSETKPGAGLCTNGTLKPAAMSDLWAGRS